MNPLQLSFVHRLFRGRQNVYVSNLLREHGYNYKVAFGCSLPDVKELAARILCELDNIESPLYGLTPIEVAEALWMDENIRESKLVAPMLYPRGTMTIEVAERWANNIPTPEVADVVSMYAFQYSIGEEIVSRWSTSDIAMKQYCARNVAKRLSL